MPLAIVAGAIANKPLNGGEAWVRLSWVLGLRRLGFEVHFVEVIQAAACVDGSGRRVPFEESVNREHFDATVRDFELGGRASLLDEHEQALRGPAAAELAEVAAAADVLFDLSGHLAGSDMPPARLRVYVDLDPGFTQSWHVDPAIPFELPDYEAFVTVGSNIGTATCSIPTAGRAWMTTLPPVLLEQWPSSPLPAGGPRFTTVASWRSPHGAVELDGHSVELKHHAFRRMIELPGEVPDARFELALEIDPADDGDRRALADRGWGVVPARELTGSPSAYREYVRGSGGEFSVCQPLYAQTGSGWFSDRTAAYLASGRPALVQDTGLAGRLALGEGLLTFTTTAEAAAGAGRIAAEPQAHAAAARALAQRHLDSDVVLGALLERLGVGG